MFLEVDNNPKDIYSDYINTKIILWLAWNMNRKFEEPLAFDFAISILFENSVKIFSTYYSVESK